ncbi:MAG: hypothetical protein A3C43_00270 [Candidatus Schekmanbacteria bacterium RIFCSPHIGHO2_02_FULL_38_11]|uniref:FAD-binding PCMH-type domain-containing protein n=1 Tax=Candidatus Schekmanbacteria bacterium RIFCSPLOWO2_12_FULL_38_15 TaxID=1817883 RepID=A0A1F7SHT8_9BACT|nr:MAG: hypothetical protein A2043_01515 [Candidatus Schekmanbacteria bacterium GWA2_38_9]OGL49539.1 MAG: hypothetical protein A3H37_02380 [Candidatus Schekmanbacteria bacterium RIFCSPLOWO2_02_FULL_38_14]OGL52727.1 MAG: hypothetical protein A3G31_03650 [Candidatus Schekmanbacteria bacterium RIFCSPLOWO2_12_FULL_38_15]OGL53955.1 MAG: hypothetical protein A3C43_00270 [Candidatus Schekmanbacteria bacterium RIFCSPHIGHO2_02_FULL_38_11]
MLTSRVIFFILIPIFQRKNSVRLPKFDYHCPETVREACSVLKEHKGNAKILAGGTDLLVAMKQRAKKPAHLVSLRKIKELKGFEYLSGKGLKIGPMSTLQSVAKADIIIKKYPILSLAADSVASQQIRNTGTIGGNICLDSRCWYYNQTQLWRDAKPLCFKTKGSVCHVIKGSNRCNAVFSSDTATALMALNAKVKILNSEGTSKTIPLDEFYSKTGEPVNILKEDEILTEILIPEDSQDGKSSFSRLAFRDGIEYPIANTAIKITLENNKVCRDARIVTGAVTSFPIRTTEAENMLKGKKISADLINEVAKAASKEIKVIPYLWASPSYKRKMAETLVKRGIEKVLDFI